MNAVPERKNGTSRVSLVYLRLFSWVLRLLSSVWAVVVCLSVYMYVYVRAWESIQIE